MTEIIEWQWALIIGFGLLFFITAPYSKTVATFFSAESKKGKKPGVALLTSSLLISWIFAKSITNSANLGLSIGWLGGVAYGAYYCSFLVAGIVIYRMRTRGGFQSIHQFIQSKFGKSALALFSLLIGFRLFNEVWSNTMVIGSYFGDMGSGSYYSAILVFTALTLAYTLKGGLRSSLLTDAIQLFFFGVLMVLLLGFILPKTEPAVFDTSTSEWQAGLNLLFVALLQSFSYPFHDPVLTDRGFISSPKTTLKSYVLAGIVGFILLSAFGLIGVFAKQEGLSGQAPVEVGKLLGIGGMLAMNFIMVTSAASTLDSTFSSFSKLTVKDLRLGNKQPLKWGRWSMVMITILGTLPIFADPKILSATTVSGTMVIGLAPVFIFWNRPSGKWAFLSSVLFGILVGVLHATHTFPPFLIFGSATYAPLLWANIWGLLGCTLLFLAFNKN